MRVPTSPTHIIQTPRHVVRARRGAVGHAGRCYSGAPGRCRCRRRSWFCQVLTVRTCLRPLSALAERGVLNPKRRAIARWMPIVRALNGNPRVAFGHCCVYRNRRSPAEKLNLMTDFKMAAPRPPVRSFASAREGGPAHRVTWWPRGPPESGSRISPSPFPAGAIGRREVVPPTHPRVRLSKTASSKVV